ncbi:MAG: DUF1275 domain-containing protein [Actinomycetota bacterium]|nr:DUF1275 domain-containing protein [Actinomycetota bacterium]
MSTTPAAAASTALLPAPPRLIAIAIVLSFAAGATDAFAFLQLGGIFTANMTGNMVLMGLVQRPDYLGTLFGGSVAIAAFAVGVYVALRIARPGSHRGLVVVLAMTAAAQVLVLIGWLVTAQPPSLLMRVALIVISTLAMAGADVGRAPDRGALGRDDDLRDGHAHEPHGGLRGSQDPGHRDPDRRDRRAHPRRPVRRAARIRRPAAGCRAADRPDARRPRDPRARARRVARHGRVTFQALMPA